VTAYQVMPGLTAELAQPTARRVVGLLGDPYLAIFCDRASATTWHVSVAEAGTVVETIQPVPGSRVASFISQATERVPASWRADHGRPFHAALTQPLAVDRRSVYFIQPESGGPIKIGVAQDPAARLAQIQFMSPLRLCLVGTIPGVGAAGEAALHERFSKHRLHGEWFDISREEVAACCVEAAA